MPHPRLALLALAALFVATYATPAGAAPPPAVSSVTLPERGFDFAIDPETGAVAVVLAEKNAIALYPKLAATGDLSGVVRVEVAKLPIGIVYKRTARRAVFAVACHDVRKMVVLDARTLSVVKEILLSIESPSSVVASSNPADPYVWYCGARGHDSAAGRVNLDTLEDEGKPTGGRSHDSVMDMAVSPDGRRIYTRGPWSPSGFQCLDVVPGPDGKATLRSAFYDHKGVAAYVTDTTGDFVATGGALFTADLRTEVAKLPTPAELFLPGKPYCIGVDGRDAVAMSLNTFKAAARVPLAPEAAEKAEKAGAPPGGRRGAGRQEAEALEVGGSGGDFKSFTYRRRFLFDPKSQRIIIALGATVHLVPLAALGSLDEPFLSLRVDAPAPLSPSTPAKIGLRRLDPRAKVELKAGPRGMSLEGDALAWTPADDQVGSQRVTLRISAGAVEREVVVALAVERPHASLGFVPQDVQASADGRFAVAFSGKRDGSFGGPGEGGGGRIAVIDVARATVTAQRSFATPIAAAAVDGASVYAALADSDVLLILDRATLADGKRVFTDGRATRLLAAGDVVIVETNRGATAFSRDGAPRNDLVPPRPAETRGFGGGAVASRIDAERVALDGLLLDGSLREVRGVLGAGAFISEALGPAGRFGAGDDPFGRAPPPNRWGASYPGTGELQVGGRVVATIPRDAVVTLLADRPAAAALSLSSAQAKDDTTTRADIVLRDLVEGGQATALTLFERTASRYGEASGGERTLRLVSAGRALIAVSGQDVYALDLGAPEAAKLPIPLHFEPGAGATVLDAGDTAPVVVSLAAKGGAAPVQYALRGETAGIEIDPASGKVTLDPAKVGERLAATVAAYMAQRGERDAMTAYGTAAGPRFKRIAGRDPKGVPANLALTITATDPKNQTATVTHHVTVDLPLELVKAKLDGLRPKRPSTPAPTAGPAGDESDSSLRRRVAELERRMAELEEEIQRLKRR